MHRWVRKRRWWQTLCATSSSPGRTLQPSSHARHRTFHNFFLWLYNLTNRPKTFYVFLYLHCILTRHQIPSKPTLLPLTPTSSWTVRELFVLFSFYEDQSLQHWFVAKQNMAMTRMFQCLVLIFWLKLAALIVKCLSASRLGDENIIFFCYFHFLVKDVTMTRMSQCLPPTWKSWKSRPMSLTAGQEWSLVRWQKQNIQILRFNFLIALFAFNFFLAWILLPNIWIQSIIKKKLSNAKTA